MNFRNNKTTNTPGTLTVKGLEYTLVRDGIFYFIEFINYEKELYKTKSTLSSTPNVVFYNENGTDKVLLDYSSANDTDIAYLDSFFSGMVAGSGFSLTNAAYLQEAKGIEADLTSNLVFKEFKNNYVFAEKISTTSKSDKTDIYRNSLFIDTPQLLAGVSLGFTPLTKSIALINNIIDQNSIFQNLGLQIGDIIEIVNKNSNNNSKKIKVINIKTLNDKEIIETDEPVAVESLVGTPTLIKLYTPGKLKPSETVNLSDQSELGCCVKVNNVQNLKNYVSANLNNGGATMSGLFYTTTLYDPINNTNFDVKVIENTTRDQCKVISKRDDMFSVDCRVEFTAQDIELISEEQKTNQEYSANPINSIDVAFNGPSFVFKKSQSDLFQETSFIYDSESRILRVKPNTTYRLNQNDITNINKNLFFFVRTATVSLAAQRIINALNASQLTEYGRVWGTIKRAGYGSTIYFDTQEDLEILLVSSNLDTPTYTILNTNNNSPDSFNVRIIPNL